MQEGLSRSSPLMGLFNPTDQSINLKLVYYGPAFGGKTTNLNVVQRFLDPSGDRVLSVNTGRDTTLFFDYLPLHLRLLDRYTVRVQGYTVPGQVQFNTTRRLVLKGCDGVAFVADSTPSRRIANVRSYQNLDENLRELGIAVERLPRVVQQNKRDVAGAIAARELEADLGLEPGRAIPAFAVQTIGVMETFRELLRAVLGRAHQEFELDRVGLDLAVLLDAMDDTLRDRVAPDAPVDPSEPRIRTIVRVGEPRELLAGGEERLLEGAIQAGIDLAELCGSIAEERTRALERGRTLIETGQRVVHDLRKPLVVFQNALFLLESGRNPEHRERALSMARDVATQMSGLIDRFARLLKAEEEAEIGDQDVSLADLTESVMRRLAGLASDQAVELTFSEDLPVVRGKREELASLLANLVGNAIKYRDPLRVRRTVHVHGRTVARGYLLGVSDNGIGIPAEDIATVFTKHRRAGNTGQVQGTGLGLHIAREIAKAHGARIGVRSSVGRGTLFFVVFPPSRLRGDAAKDAANSTALPGRSA